MAAAYRQIKLPNGKIGRFPTDMSNADIEAVLRNQFAPPKEEESTGLGGIASDIGESLENAPGQIWEALKSLPGELYKSGKQAVTHPIRAAENLGAGLLEGIKGGVNIPSNIAAYLDKKDIGRGGVEDFIKSLNIGDTGLQKAVLGEPQEGDELLQSLGSFAPYAKLGGLAKGLKGTARRAGAAGLYGAGQNEDPLITALMGLTGEAGVKGAKGAKNALSNVKNLDPARMFRGELTPEQLERNFRAAQGTNTPLGSVLEEPKLKFLFENLSSQVPFSGAKGMLDQIKSQVEGQGEHVMKSIEPEGITGDTNDLVKSLLDTAFKEHKVKKNELYKERNKIAEKEGHGLELTNFNKLASDTARSIEESPLYQNDPDFRKAYKKLLGFEDTDIKVKSPIVDASGKPIISKVIKPSISEATMTANTLYDEGQRMSSSPLPKDRSLGSLYKRMSHALRNDVEQSIEGTGSEELKKAHKNAKENYQKNFAQFLDKNVYKLLAQDKDPQKIVHEIIKPGAKQDQFRDIEKINNLLPESKKNLLGFTYLKGAENKYGEMEPKKLAALVNSLGKRQFKALFPDEFVRQKILDYGKLRGMNEEALSVLHNPKTGARNTQTIMAGLQGLLAGTSGNPFTALIPSVAANVTNRVLTSPGIREKLVKRMIEHSKTLKEPKIKKDSLTDGLSEPLAQALLAAQPKHKPLELELVKQFKSKN